MINNLGTPSSELQINFDVLQIDTENSATGLALSFDFAFGFWWKLLVNEVSFVKISRYSKYSENVQLFLPTYEFPS